MLNLAQFGNSVVQGIARCFMAPPPRDEEAAHLALLADLTDRVRHAPKSPLDLASETAKALLPGHTFTYYRFWVRQINRLGAMDGMERIILKRYREAMWEQRHGFDERIAEAAEVTR